jgi:hypothetical protein
MRSGVPFLLQNLGAGSSRGSSGQVAVKIAKQLRRPSKFCRRVRDSYGKGAFSDFCALQVNLCNGRLDPGLPLASWKNQADSGRTSGLLYQTVYCCEMRARVRVKAMKLIPSGITPLPQVRPRMRSRRLYHPENVLPLKAADWTSSQNFF